MQENQTEVSKSITPASDIFPLEMFKMYLLNPEKNILGVENFDGLSKKEDLSHMIILFSTGIKRISDKKEYVEALFCRCSTPKHIEATLFDYEKFYSDPIDETDVALVGRMSVFYGLDLQEIFKEFNQNAGNFEKIFENTQRW